MRLHVMLALALLATSSANDDGLDEQRAIGAHRFKLKQQLSAARIKYRKDETTEALEEKLRKHTLEQPAYSASGRKKKKDPKVAFEIGMLGLFDTIDTDASGFISQEEFIAQSSLDIETGKPIPEELATKKFQEMDGNFDDVLSRVEAKKYILATAQSLEAVEASLKGGWKHSAEQLEALPAAEKSQRQLAAAWAALKRGKRPARPNDDLPKQEL